MLFMISPCKRIFQWKLPLQYLKNDYCRLALIDGKFWFLDYSAMQQSREWIINASYVQRSLQTTLSSPDFIGQCTFPNIITTSMAQDLKWKIIGVDYYMIRWLSIALHAPSVLFYYIIWPASCQTAERSLTIHIQCCQGAEISAAKHKKGRKKIGGAGKVRGRTFAWFVKKGPKRGRTFVKSGFS
jgi:hypothetical protein